MRTTLPQCIRITCTPEFTWLLPSTGVARSVHSATAVVFPRKARYHIEWISNCTFGNSRKRRWNQRRIDRIITIRLGPQEKCHAWSRSQPRRGGNQFVTGADNEEGALAHASGHREVEGTYNLFPSSWGEGF